MRTFAVAAIVLMLVAAFGAVRATSPAPANCSQDEHALLCTDQASYRWPDFPYQHAVCFTFTNTWNQTIEWGTSSPIYWVTGPHGAAYMVTGYLIDFYFMAPAGSFTDCFGAREKPLTDPAYPLGANSAGLCAEPGDYTIHFPDPSLAGSPQPPQSPWHGEELGYDLNVTFHLADPTPLQVASNARCIDTAAL